MEYAINNGIGSWIQYMNGEVLIKEIENRLGERLNEQDRNLIEALGYVEKVREFVGNPENILGSTLTKHGEIAENVDVNIGNARLIVEGLKERFTFEGVLRTAPEDFLDNGMLVQSKFYNGLNNTLRGLLEHNTKYSNFGADGNSYYIIPKDQYEIIDRILKEDNIEGLNQKTIETAKRIATEIEKRTGESFHEVVKPSVSNYNDVQQGRIHETLNREELNLKETIDKNKAKINDEEISNRKESHLNGQSVSFGEAMKIGAIAATITGTLTLVMAIRKKQRAGKSLESFTREDWKEIGIITGKGTAKGGVSGTAIYTLVNVVKTPAPVATAFVSATFGMSNLALKYRKGEITSSEFIENSQIICLDAGVASIGAVVGSMAIPIPILGVVVGSIVASFMSEIAKGYLNKKELDLIRKHQEKIQKQISRLEIIQQREVKKILKGYSNFKNLVDLAFDFQVNSKLRFDKSIELAAVCGVKEREILKSKQDIIDYFN